MSKMLPCFLNCFLISLFHLCSIVVHNDQALDIYETRPFSTFFQLFDYYHLPQISPIKLIFFVQIPEKFKFHHYIIPHPPLNTQAVSQNFHQSSTPTPKSPFSLYFLKGNDHRELSYEQSQDILRMLIESNAKSSTLIYNSSEVRRKYRTWVKTFPWIKPHYAIKSNPSLPLLMDLIEEGCNFDCASKSELELLLNLGVNPQDFVYSNPIKQDDDLQWAAQHHFPLTTADTIDELIKIKQHAPKMKILWRIAIKQEVTDHLATPFSNKFGDDLQTDEKIQNRMKQIHHMGINISGVHFHCGSGQHGSSAFERAILTARRCIEIGRQHGHEMSIMDIGGGFPAGELTKKTIDALKITQNDPLGYTVIAEPGRHFSSYSSYLLTKVIGKRHKNNKPCYHLNESLYHSFNCNLMDGVSFENSTTQFYSMINSETSSSLSIATMQPATLFGMTCDGLDIITQNIHVPTEVKVGDWMLVGGMGAYTYGCRTEFNGMKSCEKIIRWSARVEEFDNGAEPDIAM